MRTDVGERPQSHFDDLQEGHSRLVEALNAPPCDWNHVIDYLVLGAIRRSLCYMRTFRCGSATDAPQKLVAPAGRLAQAQGASDGPEQSRNDVLLGNTTGLPAGSLAAQPVFAPFRSLPG